MIVNNDAALQRFREDLTGRRILSMFTEKRKCLRIDLPVGVGKSVLLDKIVESAVQEGYFDLIIVLAPTRRILEDRAWIRNPPTDIRVINLRPRPKDSCGPGRNDLWTPLEQQGMGLYGREIICAKCDRESSCFWPDQYTSKNLGKVPVIFGTHAHLSRSVDFLDQLQTSTGAKRMLVLIDEGNFLVSPYRRRLPRVQLERFLAVLEKVQLKYSKDQSLRRLCRFIEILLTATTGDLRRPDWHTPPLGPKIAGAAQAIGWDLFGPDFWYLGPEIVAFGRSSLESRARMDNGDIRYAVEPSIGQNVVFFSGTTSQELAEHRLGVKFASPFAGVRFEHPETRWYNIPNRIGMKQYFKANAAQIFDFFGDLLAKRLREGKRVVLLAKKDFVSLCEAQMQSRLNQAGLEQYKAVSAGQAVCCNEPIHVPVIHYGMIGINDYQEFDCLFCLTGYYVNEEAVNAVLQDVLAEDFHLPIKIETVGQPLRRRAGVKRPEDRCYDLHQLAQMVLDEQELGAVVQAAGRVRPFTKPREIVLFQCGQVHGVVYDQEFQNLAAARRYFGIDTYRQQKKEKTCVDVQWCKAEGMTQKQTANQLSINVRTVKRHWRGT